MIAKLKTSFLYLLMLLPMHVFAAPIYYYPYLSGTLGAGQGNLSTSNPSIRYAGLLDQYPLASQYSKSILYGLNGGVQFANEEKCFAIDIGLGIYSEPNYNYRGSLNETDDATIMLANYRFNVSTLRLMVEAQFNIVLGSFSPFISGGLGAARNYANNYSESPNTSSLYIPLPPFQSQTTTQFAYQLGGGVSYLFNTTKKPLAYKQERVSLGYRYVNSGQVPFGTRGSVYPHTLNVGNLWQNEIYFSYTHLF